MKVVIINKSDSTGGAAVVSFRLLEALRAAGVDARMLVAEKLTDSSYVERAAPTSLLRLPFLTERLRVFVSNGFDRSTLFRIDPACDGVDLARHPAVREADVICLNWVNQGFLSLRGLHRLASLGKPIVWTMHDMWNMTGVCHHAGLCRGFMKECGLCPLLGKHASANDLSHRTWLGKRRLYAAKRPDGRNSFTFVAVSRWLAGRAAESLLLGAEDHPDVMVIPNAFPFPESETPHRSGEGLRIVLGAARLDDPIKGLGILKSATHLLRSLYPETASRLSLVTFGGVKDPATLSDFGIPTRHMGSVRGAERIREIYAGADIVVSSSLYETLPGTLVEGQAYGCVPVAFDHGGQRDIVDHGETGFLARFSEDEGEAARNLAEAIAKAAEALTANAEAPAQWRKRMYEKARSRFGAEAVAAGYISLFGELI